jgi:hypothetical protein
MADWKKDEQEMVFKYMFVDINTCIVLEIAVVMQVASC